MTPRESTTVREGAGTVLVIDDEATVRIVTVRALKAFGFEALEAEDGAAGVEAFKANRESVVAVLLDMTMPRMNGEDTFMEIKRLDPDARIILMSGYSEQDATERFGGSGLSGFIQKPYELATLRSTLEAALRDAQS